MLCRSAILMSCMLAIGASAWAQTPVDGINQTRTQWVAGWNAKQLDRVMALYAEDAVLSPSSGERIAGKDKIRAYFKRILDSPGTTTLKVSSEKTASAGELGYDSGSYEQTRAVGGVTISGNVTVSGNVVIGGGGTHTTRGSYLVVLRRETGMWLIIQQATTEIVQPSSH